MYVYMCIHACMCALYVCIYTYILSNMDFMPTFCWHNFVDCITPIYSSGLNSNRETLLNILSWLWFFLLLTHIVASTLKKKNFNPLLYIQIKWRYAHTCVRLCQPALWQSLNIEAHHFCSLGFGMYVYYWGCTFLSFVLGTMSGKPFVIEACNSHNK